MNSESRANLGQRADGGSDRPRIRLLHHLARSGGTVISRCLASMDRVVLLSEIHPLGVRMFDPLQQAHRWYGLVSPDDLQRLQGQWIAFADAIGLIARRCVEQGRLLVLRDWSHLDYTGFPYAAPVYRSRLTESLQGDFELVRTATVRHPLDQWISLSTKPAFRGRLDPGSYLEGVERFSEDAVGIGFARYEDFTRAPDDTLREICAALDLPFDAGYRDRWAEYANITGDVMRGRGGTEIRPLPRQPVDSQERRAFCALPAYARILRRLGYDD